MRKAATAEVALINTKQRVSAQRGRASFRFGCQRSRLRSNFVAAGPLRDGRSRPTTSVSGKCRMK